MKKYISLFMIAAAAVLGTACSNNENELPEYAAGLNVVKAETAFNVVGGTKEVKMTSDRPRPTLKMPGDGDEEG